jgi:hypothetical protein
MSQADIRAVDNPISALFDLSEDVNNEAPRFRKLVRYASAFIIIWLVVDFILILATIRESLLVGGLLVAIFILGLATLSLLMSMNDFIRYYVMRHRAIMSVRNDEPVIKVPPGPTPVARLLVHLQSRNPELNYLYAPNYAPLPTAVQGRSGTIYQLDAYLTRHSSFPWWLIGRGYPGYQLFVKLFDHAPRPEELMWFKAAAEDIARAKRMPASRVIALWPRRNEDELSEESYNILMSQVVRSSHRGKHFASSLELIMENDDGSYEFIPFVADQVRFSSR